MTRNRLQLPAAVGDPKLTEAAPDLRDACLRMLTVTGHTASCSERRAYGLDECTRTCRKLRTALRKAGVEIRDLYIDQPAGDA